MTWENFSNKGVGLALSWYINTFTGNVAEVNFLLLCTVLESLNKKYSYRASKKLLPKQIYKQIRNEVLKLISDFNQNIDNEDYLQKYKIFEAKIQKSFADGAYNQIGNLRSGLQEMLNAYSVPYNDLFPELEFIKIRDKIVHEGFSEVDGVNLNLAIELCKLSNLVVRAFLAILEYQGNYMEYVKIEIDDKLGCSRHGLICRRFPFIYSEENTV